MVFSGIFGNGRQQKRHRSQRSKKNMGLLVRYKVLHIFFSYFKQHTVPQALLRAILFLMGGGGGEWEGGGGGKEVVSRVL